MERTCAEVFCTIAARLQKDAARLQKDAATTQEKQPAASTEKQKSSSGAGGTAGVELTAQQPLAQTTPTPASETQLTSGPINANTKLDDKQKRISPDGDVLAKEPDFFVGLLSLRLVEIKDIDNELRKTIANSGTVMSDVQFQQSIAAAKALSAVCLPAQRLPLF
jgi:hypothetical protein